MNKRIVIFCAILVAGVILLLAAEPIGSGGVLLVKSPASKVAGDTIYWNGSDYVRNALGSAGKVMLVGTNRPYWAGAIPVALISEIDLSTTTFDGQLSKAAGGAGADVSGVTFPSSGTIPTASTLTSGNVPVATGANTIGDSKVTITGQTNLNVGTLTSSNNVSTPLVTLTGSGVGTFQASSSSGIQITNNSDAGPLTIGMPLTLRSNVTASGTINGTTIPTSKTIVVTTDTSFNGLTITASTGTLTVPNGTTVTTPAATDTLVGRASTDTLQFKKISHAAAPATDDTYTGIDITGLNNSGGVTQWDVVYLNGSSQWVLADANGSGTYPARGLATATVSTGNATTVVIQGVIRNDGWSWTPGGTIYLSTTAGAMTQTAPSTTDDRIQTLGFALSSTVMRLFPSGDIGKAP